MDNIIELKSWWSMLQLNKFGQAFLKLTTQLHSNANIFIIKLRNYPIKLER